MIVQTHYFNNGNDLSESKVNALGVAITRLLGRAPHKSSQINSPNIVGGIDQLSIFPSKAWDSAVNMVVELRLIRIQHPYLNSSILAQYLALNAGKYNFTRMQKMVFKKAPTFDLNDISLNKEILPGLTTGVKLELAGRLTTQRSIPRKTVENKHTGSFTVDHRVSSGQPQNPFVNLSQYTSKNKLGTYTIKV